MTFLSCNLDANYVFEILKLRMKSLDSISSFLRIYFKIFDVISLKNTHFNQSCATIHDWVFLVEMSEFDASRLSERA